jgi:DNA polymerase-3 subunit delta'
MTAPTELMSGVWADLTGQEPTVEVLANAAHAAAQRLAGVQGVSGMTHAWLITGPPGSGRSNAARAFAAALQCADEGCGECNACRTALSGAHPDVTLVRTEQLSLRVDEIRELVLKSAMSPVGSRWQVLVVEDADRLTEQAADALLKSLEEPAERTVWLLCAPTVEDVVPTIRSRCRLLVLRTPSTEAVASVLERRGIERSMALFAARASQGHIGRARALASKEEVRDRRREVLSIPSQLGTLSGCLHAASALVDRAAEEAKSATVELDTKERTELENALGVSGKGGKTRSLQAALKELEDRQKVRANRLRRDALDRALLDLMSYYRDVLAVGLGTDAELVNLELRPDITRAATSMPPEAVLAKIDAILACREAIAANVAPLLAVEAMTISLR